MAVSAYPLSWPQGWKRTAAAYRVNAKFSKKERVHSSFTNSSWMQSKELSVSDALERILGALQMMGIERQDVIVSTNVRTRLDGLPRSGERAPDDPGAAVYWQAEPGQPMRCMAIDQYNSVAGNLAAVAATLEAMRAIERHGGAEILNRAFTGFAALPSSTEGASWWSTLGVEADASEAQIQQAYRAKARIAHPDAPTGSDEAIRELNIAREQGLAAARGRG